MSTGLAADPGLQDPGLVTNENLDIRLALLDSRIKSLESELLRAAANTRECFYYLLGAMLFSSFCMLLALR
ncbi:MAG TPA: hypothetical protein VNO53_08900 [Steroidobacteraceae bacterium]|nr:hypothetical protein [Steroidobacteraceae bacterium]